MTKERPPTKATQNSKIKAKVKNQATNQIKTANQNKTPTQNQKTAKETKSKTIKSHLKTSREKIQTQIKTI